MKFPQVISHPSEGKHMLHNSLSPKGFLHILPFEKKKKNLLTLRANDFQYN